MSLLDRGICKLGLNPNQRHGPNHGAPLSMWIAFAGVITLAGTVLGMAACGG